MRIQLYHFFMTQLLLLVKLWVGGGILKSPRPPLTKPTPRPPCFLYYVKQLRIRYHPEHYKCLPKHMAGIGFKLTLGVLWSENRVYLARLPMVKEYDGTLRVGEGHGRVTEAAGFHSRRILTWLITTVFVRITFLRMLGVFDSNMILTQ